MFGEFHWKRMREKHGITQRELAEQARISQSHLALIELGHKQPSLIVAARMAGIFGVPKHCFKCKDEATQLEFDAIYHLNMLNPKIEHQEQNVVTMKKLLIWMNQ